MENKTKDALAEVGTVLQIMKNVSEVRTGDYADCIKSCVSSALQILDSIEVVGDKELCEIIVQKSWDAIEAIKDAGFLVLRGEKA